MVQEQMRACDMLPKYAGVDARYQCTQFSWSEEFARPAAEVCAVVAQACRKHSYLIATTHFEPPLPVPREGARYVGDVLCGIDADRQPHQQNARNAAIPAALWRCRACAGFLRLR